MTHYRMERLVLSLLLVIGMSASQAQNRLATLEYWLDANYDARQTVNTDGSSTTEIDVSNLCYGVHTISMRVSDTEGRWGSTLFRHFLKTVPTIAENRLAKYEYWIDDYTNVKSGATSDGTIQLDIDVSSLCKGIHTLNYQVQDNEGYKSAPRLVHFLIPDLENGADLIAAYEYWFNHGTRTRIEIQPASSAVSLNDVIIEVKDVVPNTVEGYRFYAAEERAEVDDSVFFGMQVYTADDQGSLAVLSEKFPMAVPVELNMMPLSGNEEPLTVAAPTTGKMQGMKSTTTAGDILLYTLSLENVMADFYDADGKQLEAVREVAETGEMTYTLTATSACTYMLVYGASDVQTELTATLLTQNSTEIDSVWADAQEVARYNIGGQVIDSRQRGVNIVRMSDGSVRKVVVK